ncbi:MAG TPA: sigma-54 dependent transcriptional regulator [Pyrinomonadaceae bacterium]|jgi:DNA-binding NtrC family response regulator|nr:sigma-54 dependent transcriptional regulator [Pyrinomonadaceae bacterium]
MTQRTEEELRLLIVDDEEAARYGMRRALGGFGYSIEEGGSVEEARALIARGRPDLLLLDVNLPGASGLDFLRELHGADKDGPLVILITAHGSERMAVEAIKSGAHDYLAKPFELDDLRLAVKNALETVRLRRENRSLRRRIELEGAQRGPLTGASEAMERVRALIEKVAETDATILVRGESGTGKELVARAIHERSTARRRGAFVAVNCAALPSELIESELFGHEKGAFTGAASRRQGKFEQADGGTLFLDEIGDMSAGVQAKLLRALEERRIERLGGNESIPVDVRIVSATHRPLEQEIAAGNFRADLFYRLRVVTVEIPPLRERREDIPLLAETFARMASERYGLPARTLAPSALRRLLEYDWPGNVRELRNVIERAAVLAEGEELTARDLPEELKDNQGQPRSESARPAMDEPEEGGLLVPFTTDFREDRREFERRYITRCLEETGGNVTRAAAMLGMHRQSLQHKLRELGLARRYVSVATEAQD